MRKLVLTVPEVAFIAATRGALGFGAGLLLSGKFDEPRRRKVGLGLLAFGIATIPSMASGTGVATAPAVVTLALAAAAISDDRVV